MIKAAATVTTPNLALDGSNGIVPVGSQVSAPLLHANAWPSELHVLACCSCGTTATKTITVSSSDAAAAAPTTTTATAATIT